MNWLNVLYVTHGALWALVIGLAISVIRVQRSLESFRRSIERRASEGPEVGSVAPPLVSSINEQGGAPSTFALDSRPTVIWFMSVGCPPCIALRETINAIALGYEEQIHSVVTCAGTASDVDDFAGKIVNTRTVTVLPDPARANASAWRVFITPFVIVVDSNGRIRRKMAQLSMSEVQLAVDSVLSSERD